MKRLIVVGGLVTATALGTGTAHAARHTPVHRPQAAGRHAPDATSISGFGLTGDAASAFGFSGNSNIFDAIVTHIGRPHHVAHRVPHGARIDYVYTPVRVRVQHVYKGRDVRPGRSITVRALGGRTRNAATRSDLGAGAARFRPGMRVALFTQPMVDAGDGVRAVTPNFAFAYDARGRRVQSLGGHGGSSSAEAFKKALHRTH